MTTKEYWHKPTGIPVSEATMLELVRIGQFARDEFEEAINFSNSQRLGDHAPSVGAVLSVTSGSIELPPRIQSARPEHGALPRR